MATNLYVNYDVAQKELASLDSNTGLWLLIDIFLTNLTLQLLCKFWKWNKIYFIIICRIKTLKLNVGHS